MAKLLKTAAVIIGGATLFVAGELLAEGLNYNDIQQQRKDYANLADVAVELSVRLDQTERMVDSCIQSASSAEIETIQCSDRLKTCLRVK